MIEKLDGLTVAKAVLVGASICGVLVGSACSHHSQPQLQDSVAPAVSNPPASTQPASPSPAAPSSTAPHSDEPEDSASVAPPAVSNSNAPGPLALPLDLDPAQAARAIPSAPSSRSSWHQRWRTDVGKGHLSVIDVSPDDKLVLLRSWEEKPIRLYQASTGKLLRRIELEGTKGDSDLFVTFVPDASIPATVVAFRDPGFGPGGVVVVDARSGDVLQTIEDVAAGDGIWSPDGKFLLAFYANLKTQRSLVTVLERSGRKLSVRGQRWMPWRIDAAALTRDNRYMLVATYPRNEVVQFDTQAGNVSWHVPAPEFTGGLALSPDDRFVAVGGAELWLIDRSDPSKKAVATGFGNNIDGVAFSPSGDTLVAASYEGRVRLFRWTPDPLGLQLTQTLRHSGSANVYAPHFFHDGKTFVTASGDRTLRAWSR